MEKNNGARRNGVGFLSLLTIAFVVLRLVGVIAWSWWWVLAPMWVPLAIALLIFLVAIIVECGRR